MTFVDLSKSSGSVRRVTVLQKASDGVITPVTVYQGSRKRRKKSTGPLRFLERGARRMGDAVEATASSYNARHRKSSSKKRDGWLRDLNVNMLKAGLKGTKRLKLRRLVVF
jgi:hypothetical protein